MKQPKVSGVGTHIARRLRSYGIRYESSSGCNCYKLMIDMDKAGPVKVRRNIDRWTKEVEDSAKGWFKEERDKNNTWKRRFVLRTAEAISKFKTRDLILWGCEQAEKDLEWRKEQIRGYHAN